MAYMIGNLLAVYVLSKLLEWAVLKRLPLGFGIMVTLSTTVAAGLAGAARWNQARETGATDQTFSLYVVALVFGSLILITTRVLWHKRRVSKKVTSA